MDKFSKQSWEAFVISGSVENDLSSGEELVLGNCSVSAVDKDGVDATDTVLDVVTIALVGTDTISIQVKDGVDSSSPYILTFKAVTNATPANKFELDVKMYIKEN